MARFTLYNLCICARIAVMIASVNSFSTQSTQQVVEWSVGGVLADHLVLQSEHASINDLDFADDPQAVLAGV